MEDEQERLRQEIQKVEQLIEPLAAQRKVLRRQLADLESAAAFQKYGFVKDEPLAYTESLDRELHERHWSTYNIRGYRDADVITLEEIAVERNTVYGLIRGGGGVTGNIPLEVLKDMQKTYRERSTNLQGNTDEGMAGDAP